MFHDSTKEIILSSLNGINGTIFMYGQTGAGKTYTMLGDYSTEILKPSAAQLKQHQKRSLMNAADRRIQLDQSSINDAASESRSVKNVGRPKTSLLQSALGKTQSMMRGKVPQLGIESVEEGQEPLPKHASLGGSVRNKDNLMFG